MDHLVTRLRSMSIDKGKDKKLARSSSSSSSSSLPHPSSQGTRSAASPANTLPLPHTHVPRTTITDATFAAINNKLPILLPPPTLFSPGQSSDILNRSDLEELDALFPSSYQGYQWNLLFSLANHGASYNTFYRRVKGKSPTLLVVRTTENEVFGGFTTTPWAIHTNVQGPVYYGTGESFLFKLKPFRRGDSLGSSQDGVFNDERDEEQKVVNYYPWTRINSYYMLSTERSIGMGGGGGEFGLFIGDDFETGVSGESETFYNAPLARNHHFDVLSFECWTLEHPIVDYSSPSLGSSSSANGGRPSMHARSQSLDPRYGQSKEYKSFYEVLERENRDTHTHTHTRLGRSQSCLYNPAVGLSACNSLGGGEEGYTD